ncbi:YdcF family protein [Pseudonocardia sichuanensis]
MRSPSRVRAAVWGAVASALVILWAEIVHSRASRSLVGADRGGSEAIVVLGYRNEDPRRANRLNRWRVRAALRSIDPRAPESRMVFCGTTRTARGSVSEASMMAAYAVERLGYSGPVVLEEESRNTWENVVNAVPLIEDVDRIKIVSNPLHAQKGRLYLHRLRPDLAGRLVRAEDYRPGEWAPLKPFFAVYGLRKPVGGTPGAGAG